MERPPESASAASVYIVDDDAMVRRALSRFLRSAGYAVETFGSAEAFLARDPVPERGFALLDVRMPEKSGPELQTELAARGSPLELIFMSALDDAPTRQRVLAAGARAWFAKPIDGDALLAALAPPRRARHPAG